MSLASACSRQLEVSIVEAKMSAAMTTVEFLSYLRNQKVDVWTEDGKLRYRSNGGPLTATLQTELSQRRSEILEFLGAAMFVGNTAPPPIYRFERSGELPLSY